MAVAELEDLFGRIELTIFPRTWDAYQDKLQRDKVVVVWGKAEVRENGTPKLLVERVNDSLEIASSADTKPNHEAPIDDNPMPTIAENLEDTGVSNGAAVAANVPPNTAVRNVAESVTIDYGAPPEPEFPADIPYDDGIVMADMPEVGASVIKPPSKKNSKDVHVEAKNGKTPATVLPVPTPEPVPPLTTGPIVVVIRRCGDNKQDVARLEAVHQTLIQFSGEQRFSICLRNAGRADMTIDFPNDITRDCAELRMKLAGLGAEMVRSA
jgi:hypothetical protein